MGRLLRVLSACLLDRQLRFFLFLFTLIIPALLLRVALPRLLIMRYAGSFRQDRVRASHRVVELILKLVDVEISTPAA